MAYFSWKDLDITYAGTSLKAYLISLNGPKVNAVMNEFQPAGVAWPTPLDTGMRSHDPYVAQFMFDGTASGPALKCALGTSATLTVALGTGLSDSGTYIVSDFEVAPDPGGDHKLNVTFTPTGAQVLDVTE